jgi:hypothetical protein
MCKNDMVAYYFGEGMQYRLPSTAKNLKAFQQKHRNKVKYAAIEIVTKMYRIHCE